MARPLTKRRIHTVIEDQVFRPRSATLPEPGRNCLTLDGLEALRLADLEGLYQEEAARRMDVSRTTFARVLATARGAVADALVHGKSVEIKGGVVQRQHRDRWPCPIHGGRHRLGRGCRCDPGKGGWRQQG